MVLDQKRSGHNLERGQLTASFLGSRNVGSHARSQVVAHVADHCSSLHPPSRGEFPTLMCTAQIETGRRGVLED